MVDDSQALSAEDIAWVKTYAAEVLQAFRQEFAAAADRFKERQVLLCGSLQRCNTETVLKNGRRYFRAVNEAHNELCVASALLPNARLKFIRLEYEPALATAGIRRRPLGG